jgi:hypothetical protein
VSSSREDIRGGHGRHRIQRRELQDQIILANPIGLPATCIHPAAGMVVVVLATDCCLLGLFGPLALAKADTRAAAILVDEFDTVLLERTTNRLNRFS